MNEYDDIIDLPHYEPRHKRMPLANRAAQFAPFAALSGHHDAIDETARMTDKKMELSESDQKELNQKIIYAINKRLTISLTFFQPDGLKDGGHYVTVCGMISKISEYERTIYLNNETIVPIDLVTDIKLVE